MLHSKCQQIWKTRIFQSQDWKKLLFIPIPKKGNAKECSNYCIIVLISHASKFILTILQARLPQYVNQELPDVRPDFIDYAKAFDCVEHNNLWKILKEMGIPDHLACLWEIYMQVKKQQLELDMKQWTASKLGKGYIKAVYCHSAIIIYMLSTSCEMLGWMSHNLESRFQEKQKQPQICRRHH